MHGNAVIAMKCKENEIPWMVLKDLRIRYFVLLTPSRVSGGPTDRFVCQSTKWSVELLSCHFRGFAILICLFLRQSCTFWKNDNFNLIYICWYHRWTSSWWLMNGQRQFHYWVILTHKFLCCLTWYAWGLLYNCFCGVRANGCHPETVSPLRGRCQSLLMSLQNFFTSLSLVFP